MFATIVSRRIAPRRTSDGLEGGRNGSMKKKLRKSLLTALKIIIAFALLAWVFSGVYWNDYLVTKDGKSYSVQPGEPVSDGMITVSHGVLWWRAETTIALADCRKVPGGGDQRIRKGFLSVLKDIRWPLLTLGWAGFVVPVLIIAVRWRMLLRVQDIHISTWEAVRLTFLGYFFNSVVPGTVGGDLVKAYYVSRHTHRKIAAVLATFVDRVLGLAELAILAGVMCGAVLLFGLAAFSTMQTPLIALGAALLLTAVVLTLLLSKRCRRVLRLQRLYGKLPIARHVEEIGRAAAIFRENFPVMLRAVMITFLAHIFWVGSIALIGASLSLNVPWYTYFVYVPLIYIIGAVPLTPGGVGLVEKLFVVFFAPVNPTLVLALALFARLIPVFWSLPGAWVAVTGPRLPRTDAMKAELGLDVENPA